jgi:hypothetical protein
MSYWHTCKDYFANNVCPDWFNFYLLEKSAKSEKFLVTLLAFDFLFHLLLLWCSRFHL